MSASGTITVNLEGLSMLDKIEELGLARKVDILNAIAIKNTGLKHVELFAVKVMSGVQALGDDIEPSLPNSRMLILTQLSWAGAEPELSWRKRKNGASASGRVLSTLAGVKVSGADYQFDEPVTKGTTYNITASQDCTFDYFLVIEYTIGL